MSELEAGRFADWLVQVEGAVEGSSGSDVPCGECTACCTSSQFVHIAPSETEAISSIPAVLLVAAPRLPDGHLVLGFDDNGRCPMLKDDRCSIYDHRPQACRAFDCRVFAATDMATGDPHRVGIDRQVARWRFNYPEPIDEISQRAVHAASRFLQENRDALSELVSHVDGPTIAVLAIAIHHVFIADGDHVDDRELVSPDPQEALQAVEAFVERRRTDI